MCGQAWVVHGAVMLSSRCTRGTPGSHLIVFRHTLAIVVLQQGFLQQDAGTVSTVLGTMEFSAADDSTTFLCQID